VAFDERLRQDVGQAQDGLHRPAALFNGAGEPAELAITGAG
jgi:hypothetical protein